jgi:integrase
MKADGVGIADNDLIFCARNGEPVRRQNFLRRDFYPLLERAKLPRIHFHDLRHTCAILLASMDTPVVVVSALLGHKDPTITLRTYQHAFEGGAGDAAQRLGASFSTEKKSSKRPRRTRSSG